MWQMECPRVSARPPLTVGRRPDRRSHPLCAAAVSVLAAGALGCGTHGADASPPREGGWPNEPAGFTTITENSFSVIPSDRWSGSPADLANLSVISDATAPTAPPNVAQGLYPVGLAGGRGPFNYYLAPLAGNPTKLYLAFWFKYSSNYVPNGVVNKIYYIWIHGNPSITLDMMADYTTQIRTQNMPSGSVNYDGSSKSYGSGAGTGSPNLAYGQPGSGNVVLTLGQWHLWEQILDCNTAGNFDGTMKWWIDGTLVGWYNNVGFAGSSESHVWERIAWNPIYGGGGPAVGQNMWLYMDHLHASGS